jgi:hypothetical protein
LLLLLVTEQKGQNAAHDVTNPVRVQDQVIDASDHRFLIYYIEAIVFGQCGRQRRRVFQ